MIEWLIGGWLGDGLGLVGWLDGRLKGMRVELGSGRADCYRVDRLGKYFNRAYCP